MNIEKLILLVQQYEELYNLQSSQYSNQKRRDVIWEEIGKLMNQPGDKCRLQWVRVRDNYRKAKKLRKTKSGDDGKIKKPIKYDKELSFLVPFISWQETQDTNLSSQQESQDVVGSEEKIKENLNDSDDNNSDTEKAVSTELPVLSPAPSSSGSAVSTISALKSKKRKVAKPPSAINLFQNYMENKKSKEACSCNKNEHPMFNFFKSLAQTVQTFPPALQVEVKGKVFGIVNEAEAKLAQSNTDSQFSSTTTVPITPIPGGYEANVQGNILSNNLLDISNSRFAGGWYYNNGT